ncbi:SET domain-containing protein [Paraburkholderia sp. UYCP14C]|nr:SET domain-containing protein [Paraburkholderia sp. UYCP14C]
MQVEGAGRRVRQQDRWLSVYRAGRLPRELADGRVIDGSRGGNSARFLNHACSPNCEAIETGERVFIHALAAIAPGEELFIDYGLAVDGAVTNDIRAQYTCHCGTSAGRRTMLGKQR